MGKRILLAEDSLTIRRVFELTFAQSDVSLTMVDNGVDAIRLAETTVPDLVVADVTLPDKDGFQVAEELMAAEKTRSCPILILSGTLAPFDEERFRKCGARGVLFKPFESRELIDKVNGILRGAEEAGKKDKEDILPAAEEPWDFSDVLEEVEKESGKPSVTAEMKRPEDLLAGASLVPPGAEKGVSLGEFDVSLEDLEEPATVVHIEGEPATDAPEAVTDLSKAVEAVEAIEELEEIAEIEEVRMLQATGPISEKEPPPAAPPPAAPPAAAALDDALREQFSARAGEIIERVTAETVEKVLWEQMDRIVAEFSEKIRESVETVAWEVIPQAAEALIREEISRIREKTEKKTP
jgi:DNA-binding response OmpR family regulator